MPEDIRILDLANPQLPQTFLDQISGVAPMADALVLERDAVVTQASNETGLTDFGEDGWQERLDVVLQGLREDAELSPIGKLSGYAQLVSFAKNRLLLEDLWKRHPEIDDVKQDPPIIIAGLPRSGTALVGSTRTGACRQRKTRGRTTGPAP